MRQLQHTATNYPSVGLDDFILQHTTARCNTLQHTATHCNTMQHTGSHWITLHQTATHGNTLTLALASIPLHCKKLQHTATHCNTLTRAMSSMSTRVDTCISNLLPPPHPRVCRGSTEILCGAVDERGKGSAR